MFNRSTTSSFHTMKIKAITKKGLLVALLATCIVSCDSTDPGSETEEDGQDGIAGTYRATEFTYFGFGSGGCQSNSMFDALSRGGSFDLILAEDGTLEAFFDAGGERGAFDASYRVEGDTLIFTGRHFYSAVWRNARWKIDLPRLTQFVTGICGANVNFIKE